MDPLLDEKIVLTISQIFPEYFREVLGVDARREAFGPSKNEGLCYESCTSVEFSGEINGKLFIAMDGYTKLKLLPRIAKSFQIDPTTKTTSSSVVMEFNNQIVAQLAGEMHTGGFDMEIYPPENLSNKMVPIDFSQYRQYILIYFLKAVEEKSYLGRIYLILLMKKF
ncbi:MAG: chemotaxis protein CheX [Leptospiraceae bacterium]|nr:chemotaxis protein CheX [Leptospiraceae bacterium]